MKMKLTLNVFLNAVLIWNMLLTLLSAEVLVSTNPLCYEVIIAIINFLYVSYSVFIQELAF